MILRYFIYQPVIAQCLKTNVAVVEVRFGESQEEAWRRHLVDHPESVRVDVRIFHYPGHVFPNQTEKATQSQIER